MKTLLAQPLTRSAFAPYGGLLETTGLAAQPVNDGSSLRFDGLGPLALDAEGGRPCLALFRAQARDPAGPWATLERHRLGTQTFIPLNGARCVLLVALGDEQPDPATLAAFMVGGGQAFTLGAGVWHHGLLALDAGDFVVLERQAGAPDCALATLAEPVRITLI